MRGAFGKVTLLLRPDRVPTQKTRRTYPPLPNDLLTHTPRVIAVLRAVFVEARNFGIHALSIGITAPTSFNDHLMRRLARADGAATALTFVHTTAGWKNRTPAAEPKAEVPVESGQREFGAIGPSAQAGRGVRWDPFN